MFIMMAWRFVYWELPSIIMYRKREIPQSIYDELETVKEAKPLQVGNKCIFLYSEAGSELQK